MLKLFECFIKEKIGAEVNLIILFAFQAFELFINFDDFILNKDINLYLIKYRL